MILLGFLQLAAAAVGVGEVGFLQEELGSAVIVSRVVGTLVEAGVMEGMNSEVKASFQGDQKVQVDEMETDEQIRMEIEEVVLKVG